METVDLLKIKRHTIQFKNMCLSLKNQGNTNISIQMVNLYCNSILAQLPDNKIMNPDKGHFIVEVKEISILRKIINKLITWIRKTL